MAPGQLAATHRAILLAQEVLEALLLQGQMVAVVSAAVLLRVQVATVLLLRARQSGTEGMVLVGRREVSSPLAPAQALPVQMVRDSIPAVVVGQAITLLVQLVVSQQVAVAEVMLATPAQLAAMAK